MDSKKERPIVLTAQEVNAVLAGDKTQHRAIIKMPYGAPEFRGCRDSDQGDATLWGWDGFEDGDVRVLSEIKCPFGAIGDRLWVQEPSLIHCDWDWFYADNTLVECKEPFTSNDLHLPWDDEHQEYAGPIAAEYLPRWASRILLEITNIRIERVQNTSHADAVAEGVHSFDIEARLRDQPLSVAQIVFSRHWDTKHQEHCVMWEDNPWVWVIEFKVIKPSEVISE